MLDRFWSRYISDAIERYGDKTEIEMRLISRFDVGQAVPGSATKLSMLQRRPVRRTAG
jgi:hypothetical protein